MSLLSRIASLWNAVAHRARLDRDLDDELADYVERRTAEHVNRGLTPEDARRTALIEVGGVDQVKESVKDVRAGATLDQVRQDLAHALRMLRKNSGFTAVAVTTLALGIGANTAIFSVVDTVVFRPLPYRDPARLVKIHGSRSAAPVDDMSLADLLDIRRQNTVFERVAADDGSDFAVTHENGLHESVLGGLVTVDWLTTLGVQPILGRGFLPEESQPGRDRVMVLSHSYWRRRFASDPHVVGKKLAIDRSPFTVIGVLPPNVLRYSADFLRPLVPAEYPQGRGERDLDVFARLKPGVTQEQARADLEAIARRLERDYPETNKGFGFRVRPLGKYYASIQRKARQGLLLMLAAVSLVLLIACANVANLLLTRAVARYRECVIRAALGAGRARLVRQMLVETLLLFLIGGALGLVLAHWSIDSLVALAVAGDYLPERMVVSVDGRVFAFSLLVSLLAGVTFGLAPALQASRVDPNEALRASSQALTSGVRRHRASRLLIVAELALSLVLLVGFGLMIRSFLQLHAQSSGIDAENLLETFSDGGRSFPEAVGFWRAALEQTRRLPGVQSAAVTSRPPVHGARQQQFAIEGRPIAATGEQPRAGDILISADYFTTMGIRLLKGRPFTEQDNENAPPIVIVSQSLARRYFGYDDPLGKRLSLDERAPMRCCAAAGPVEGVWREIVGVVADVRQANLDERPALTIYRPYSQIVEHDMYLMVRARSSADAARIATELRPHLLALDKSKEWMDVRPMRDVIDGSESIRLRRFVLILLGSFAGLALLLAAVGTYGVMAYAVAERTREIGIRVALGATRPAIFREVLGETMRLALAGLLVGGLAAVALTRFIASLLFEVSSTDVATYLSVSLLLVGVALLASYLPARRATEVDPMTALRHE
jgi:putative ABC transport system permease protein